MAGDGLPARAIVRTVFFELLNQNCARIKNLISKEGGRYAKADGAKKRARNAHLRE